MKKPRKSRPNRKRRASKPVLAPPRALPRAPKPIRFEHIAAIATQSAIAITRAVKARAAALAHAARELIAIGPQPHLSCMDTKLRALAMPYARHERETLALLFLPFLIVASALAAYQSARTLHAYVTAITFPEEEIGPTRSRDMSTALPELMPPTARTQAIDGETVAVDSAPAFAPAPPLHLPEILSTQTHAEIPAETEPSHNVAPIAQPSAHVAANAGNLDTAVRQIETSLALLAPANEALISLFSVSPNPIETFEADADGNPAQRGICAIDTGARLETASIRTSPTSLTDEAFGLHLAAAAQAQVGKFVIYDETYRSISYPMGDVPGLYGVCTDVVVRAYRALGIDLQALVHRSRSGTGDASIDHRRTEVLRRFFAVHGEKLPVTTFAEDYRPGDIVTYHRPQNRGSRAHVAIVSSVMAPSGRPMIVHNRGWGPQLEDALFVDEITGHYRYRGETPAGSNAGLGRTHTAAPVVPASLRTIHSPSDNQPF